MATASDAKVINGGISGVHLKKKRRGWRGILCGKLSSSQPLILEPDRSISLGISTDGVGTGTRTAQTGNSDYQIHDGYVVIDASSYDPDALLAALQTLGLKDGVRFGPMISGDFPISQIPLLESLPLIRTLRPVLNPIKGPARPLSRSLGAAVSATPAGEVGDQGDLAMGTNLVREQYGVDGSGIQVGVMSDSYNATGGADQDVAAGRLPAGVMV